MSEPDAPKTEDADKSKPAGGGNKLLLIIALGNFLGTFALGGYLAYDKLVASHASAQGKGDAHGSDAAKAGAHGEEKAEEGHGEKKEEGGHGEKKEEGGHGEKKAEGGHGADSDESINPPDGPGPIMALDPIVTNLAEPDSDRYLKVTAQLRVTSESAKAEVEAAIVPIRSAILMYFSSLAMSDITGPDKRREIQTTVRRLANEAMPSSRIKFVYFTEFVVQ
jgi:flagellar basal body-associated protein FliL